SLLSPSAPSYPPFLRRLRDRIKPTLQVMTFRAGTDLDPIGYAAWIDDDHFVVDDWVGTVQEWAKNPAQPQGPFAPKQTWQMPGQALGIAVAPDHQSIVVGGNSGFMFFTPTP